MFLDGDRAFDLVWGTATAALCLTVAVPLLWWWLPAHRRAFFGARIDPAFRLQLGYGLFGMAMAGTDLFCRFIPHDFLPYVHPTFAAMTLCYVAGLAPRTLALLRASRRLARR